MPEVARCSCSAASVLAFGGQILGGASEPRKASFVINFVHKSKREASQKDMQTRISALHGRQPDMRFWFMKDNGQRDLQLIVAGRDMTQINDTANQLASEMRRIPVAGESDLDRRTRPAGIADRAAPSGRRRSRRLDRGAVDDDPRRHARRRRRQSRQVQGRRPADPDPRRAGRSGARPHRPVAEPARADRQRRHDAARRGRRFRDRPRPDRDQPLRPHAPRDDRGGPARRRAARRGGRRDQARCRPPRTCRPASKSARPATSRS